MVKRYRLLLALSLLCLAVMLAVTAGGWGTSAPTVVGDVTVGGLPLQEGSITFFPIDGTPGGSSGAEIIDGKFEVLNGLTEGKYRIAIQGTRPSTDETISLPFDDKKIPKPVQVVPEVYRGQDSPLIEKIKAGHQEIPFDLPEISANKRSP